MIIPKVSICAECGSRFRVWGSSPFCEKCDEKLGKELDKIRKELGIVKGKLV